MKIISITLFILSTFIFAQNIKGQGCSDAGFCTIDDFKPGSTDSVSGNPNTLKVGLSYGSADHNIAAFEPIWNTIDN